MSKEHNFIKEKELLMFIELRILLEIQLNTEILNSKYKIYIKGYLGKNRNYPRL